MAAPKSSRPDIAEGVAGMPVAVFAGTTGSIFLQENEQKMARLAINRRFIDIGLDGFK
jgi:hypothetical protein